MLSMNTLKILFLNPPDTLVSSKTSQTPRRSPFKLSAQKYVTKRQKPLLDPLSTGKAEHKEHL